MLVNHILVDFPDKIKQLRQGVAMADAGQVRLLAHTLKSSLGSFGAGEARELAYNLEICGATGELVGAEEILQQLERLIERIVAFFSDPAWVNKV